MAYNRLRELRNKEGISAKEMAELLGLKTEAAYYKKESGAIKFSLEEAKLISEKIGKPIEEIFFGDVVSILEIGKSKKLSTLKPTGTG